MEVIDLKAIEQEIGETRSNLVTERLDMSFGEIMNIYQDGDLIIAPEFQRLFRWNIQQKTRFVESLLLGIPIPPIFVAEDQDGKWELVDGLQRVSTILSFFGLLQNADGGLDDTKNNWVLEEGDIIRTLDTKNMRGLPPKLQLSIKRYVCRIEILRWSTGKTNLKYELFNRLNTGGEQATEQEIRNCIFRGKSNIFNSFLKKLASNQNLKDLVKPTTKQEEQLYMDELVLRFLSLYFSDKNLLEKGENISKYMTNFMQKNVDNENFNYDLAENVFERTFELLANLQDNKKLFRGEAGPFSNNIYDVIILGVALNIDHYENNVVELDNKINDLKTSGLLKNTSSIKANSKIRTLKRIELANELFNIQ